jgi:hypothetical protein
MANNKARPITMEFAPIDTGNNDYNVVSLCPTLYSEHNITILVKAQREYIERLYALQNEIRVKYQPQFQKEADQPVVRNVILCG